MARSSEYPASGRPNIRPPFVWISGQISDLRFIQITGLHSSKFSAAVHPNLWPPFIQISGLHSPKYLVDVHPNLQPMFVRMSCRYSYKSPAAVCLNLRPPFDQISGLHSSKYSSDVRRSLADTSKFSRCSGPGTSSPMLTRLDASGRMPFEAGAVEMTFTAS